MQSIHSRFVGRRSITGPKRWLNFYKNDVYWESIAFATSIMLRFAATRSRWCDVFMSTLAGRYPGKLKNECAERWQASKRNDLDFIGTISPNLAWTKSKALLDLRPIATGLVWLRAGNARWPSGQKIWPGDKVYDPTKQTELLQLLA